MAWIRDKVYKVQYIGSKTVPVGIMLRNIEDETWYNWQTRQFTSVMPLTILQSNLPLNLQTKFIIPGDLQIWEGLIDTSNIPDGQYCLFYVDATGALIPGIWMEYFNIYRGSAEPVLPKTTVTVTE